MEKYITYALYKSIRVKVYETVANNVYAAIDEAETYFKENGIVYDNVTVK